MSTVIRRLVLVLVLVLVLASVLVLALARVLVLMLVQVQALTLAVRQARFHRNPHQDPRPASVLLAARQVQ